MLVLLVVSYLPMLVELCVVGRVVRCSVLLCVVCCAWFVVVVCC